jgi:hypothetical protein
MKLGGDSRFTVQHSYTTFCRISALELCSLATEGTQEFPPLNKMFFIGRGEFFIVAFKV